MKHTLQEGRDELQRWGKKHALGLVSGTSSGIPQRTRKPVRVTKGIYSQVAIVVESARE